LKGNLGRVGSARCLGGDLCREHDEEDVREERHGVDPVRQRADVLPPRRSGERHRLPRVVEVADQERNGDAREHPPVNQVLREAEHVTAEGIDEQKLNEIVERKPEEAVDIPSY
jgi:hypothetical protein